MWERLSEQKDAVTKVVCLLGKTFLCLSQEEWSETSLTLNALRPFEEVTKEILSEKHVSISKVVPLGPLLLRTLSSSEKEGSKLASELSAQCHRQGNRNILWSHHQHLLGHQIKKQMFKC